MTDVPVQVVVAAFASADGAEYALGQLQQAQVDGFITIRDAKVVRCDEQGTLHIDEATPQNGCRGAIVGGISGAVVGLMLGPVAWAAGAGAILGTVAYYLRQSGISQERLQELGESIKPGTSVLVALVEQTWLKEVIRSMRQAADDFATAAIQADIAMAQGWPGSVVADGLRPSNHVLPRHRADRQQM